MTNNPRKSLPHCFTDTQIRVFETKLVKGTHNRSSSFNFPKDTLSEGVLENFDHFSVIQQTLQRLKEMGTSSKELDQIVKQISNENKIKQLQPITEENPLIIKQINQETQQVKSEEQHEVDENDLQTQIMVFKLENQNLKQTIQKLKKTEENESKCSSCKCNLF